MSLLSGNTYDAAAGRESRSSFIALAAFWFVSIRFLLHDMSVKINGVIDIHFGEMNSDLVWSFLLPCLSLYFGRRLFPDGLQMTKSLPLPIERPEGAAG